MYRGLCGRTCRVAKKGNGEMDKANVKKGAGIASLLLSILAWLGQKYEWFTAKTNDGLNALAVMCGAVATFA